ncbi:MAG: TraX family protein [Cellulosilyticaceae bacterium]
MKKLNAYQMKLICALLMVLDHISFFIPGELGGVFHVISRCVSPVFAYLVVEGVFHTRDIKKYNIRLFGWAIGMQLGNSLVNYLYVGREVSVNNNIFLTLSLGLMVVTMLKYAKELEGAKKIAINILVIIPVLMSVLCEGGMVVIPFMVISFCFRDNKKVKYILYVLFSMLLFKSNFVNYGDLRTTIDMLMFNSDFMFILAIPFIASYDGTRGPSAVWNKYFFYVFYPAHLWIIATITYWVKG